MKRRISLATLLLLSALPLAALAADPAQPSTGSAKESMGERFDDAAITTKVKTAFIKDKEVKATEVKVETVQGIVQLSGFVDSRAEMQRAEQLASKVPGVKSVRNEISIKPHKE